MRRLAPCSTPQRSCGTHHAQRPTVRQGVVDCLAVWPPMRRSAPGRVARGNLTPRPSPNQAGASRRTWLVRFSRRNYSDLPHDKKIRIIPRNPPQAVAGLAPMHTKTLELYLHPFHHDPFKIVERKLHRRRMKFSIVVDPPSHTGIC